MSRFVYIMYLAKNDMYNRAPPREITVSRPWGHRCSSATKSLIPMKLPPATSRLPLG